jgi:amino acid adenylation domain-containing protein
MSSHDSILSFLHEMAGKAIRFRVEAGRLHCAAPPGVITPEVSALIASRKAAIVAALSSAAPGGELLPCRVPLSLGAASHWLMQQLHPERSYTVVMCTRIGRALEAGWLDLAWRGAQVRHGLLLARVVASGEGFDYLLDREASPLHHVSLPDADEGRLHAELRRLADAPFELDGGNLARATCLNLVDGTQVLLIAVHHVIFDGFSASVLLKTLFGEYARLAGADATVPPPQAPTFGTFVASERAMLASAEGARHKRFWDDRLEGIPATIQLTPGEVAREGVAVSGALLTRRLSGALQSSVDAFCQERGVQPSGLFLGVYQWLLHRHARQDEIAVQMPVSVRTATTDFDEIGFYFNVVPLVSRIDRDATVAGWVTRTQACLTDALFHAAYPFPLIQGALRTGYNVLYGFHDFANLHDATFTRLTDMYRLSPVEGFHQKPAGDYDLALEIFRDAEGFDLHVQGVPGHIAPLTLDDFLERYLFLLEQVVRQPDAVLSGIPWASASDRHRLATFNDTARSFPLDRCVHDFFVERAQIDPDAAAIRFRGKVLSYADYALHSERMAHVVRARGLGRDDIVALCMERSTELTVALMAVLRAGAAYMPIDPDYPDERIRYMLADSGARLLLTQPSMANRLAELAGSGCEILTIDEEMSCSGNGDSLHAFAPLPAVDPRALAYVMYTSGSTGRPKGVLIEHRALVNRLCWMQRLYPLGRADVVLQKTPYCFDVSVWEFLWTPMTGASLLMAEPGGHLDAHYLERTMKEEGVTVAHFVPSMFNVYLENARGPVENVTTLFCSGEALDRATVNRYRERFPLAHLHNLYGPTEAAIDVTAYDCDDAGAWPFVPIGKPIDNTAIHILDDSGQVVPPGVPGELHIAGTNVARGYLNRPELTTERFVPGGDLSDSPMYRTGDLARWLDDGNIQYVGRIDALVKIGGVRIEPGEIEARLNAHPGVAEAVVVPTSADGRIRLVAFYRAVRADEDDLGALPIEDLRRHMLDDLPDYMVPSAFVAVARIPVTANGKADRALLAGTVVEVKATSRAFRAPSTPTEDSLAIVWGDVFRERGFVIETSRIGTDDSFFDLGGNSVMATQVLYRIRETFDIDLPVQAILRDVTIAQLAMRIDGVRSAVGAA